MPPLNPSERIQLVQSVRDALIAEWSVQADLILRTYGLQGLDLDTEWVDYDPNVDIRRQVTEADDEVLLAIAEHLWPGEVSVSTAQQDDSAASRLWRAEHVRVFISHMAEHQEFAAAVDQELRTYKIHGFVAHTSIEPDSEWQAEIETALRSCQAFVGLLHPGFAERTWTQQEVGWALGRDLAICMVDLGEIPTGFRARHQAERGDPESAATTARRILVSLSRSRQVGSEVSSKVLAELRGARSFIDARDAALRLEEMAPLSSRILDGIADAYRENDQIYPNHVAAPICRRILTQQGREIPG